MDKPIQRKRSLKKPYSIVAIALFLALVSYWVVSDRFSSRMSKDGVQIRAVQQGPFSAYVVGNGTVVSRDIDYILPNAHGRVVSVYVESGDFVEEGQTLFVLENEELLSEYGNREIALAEARAALDAIAFELDTQKLELQMSVLQAEANYNIQEEEYKANKVLMARDNPPVSLLQFRESEIRASQLRKVYELELTRLENFEASMKSQLHQYELRVNLADNVLTRIRNRVEHLNVKARKDGIIQDVDLRPGQRVEEGIVVGLVANPNDVYIRLKVSAIQGHRLERGQAAVVVLRGEEKHGKVVRIDPNVRGTTIDVDIELNDDDANFHNNMFVSGRVVIEELQEALFVEAPPATIENGISSFYQVGPDGNYVQLTKVETGFLSAGRIQIIGGLAEGDRVVVSDTGRFNGAERVALH